MKKQIKNLKKTYKISRGQRRRNKYKMSEGKRKVEKYHILKYISEDFMFNLIYMMIHKRYPCSYKVDYHRMYYMVRLLQDWISARETKSFVEILFDGIDTVEDAENWFKHNHSFKLRKESKNYIINEVIPDKNAKDDYEKIAEYVLPCYMMKNLLQFKKLFYEVVKDKYWNDTDLWDYACRYLLMGDKEFIRFYGPDGKDFPYKLIEE